MTNDVKDVPVTEPSLLLPAIARKRLKEETMTILRVYKVAAERQQAIDRLIDKVRQDYPQAFQNDK